MGYSPTASRIAAISLVVLTFHYAILSIALHAVFHTSEKRFHTSSAVALTELGKVVVSTLMVFQTKELRPLLVEAKRVRHEEEVELELDETLPFQGPPAPGGLKIIQESEKSRKRPKSLELPMPSGLLAPMKGPAELPQLSIIPPTPALPPTPNAPPDASGLFPTRSPFERVFNRPGILDLQDYDFWELLKSVVFGNGWWKLGLPAVLYLFQSYTQYLASASLSIPVFQLTYQLKIPATALCSVLILGRALSRQQWMSLFMLTMGVGVIQLQNSNSDAIPVIDDDLVSSSLINISSVGNQTFGILAVTLACLSSGIAGTYLEKILKTETASTTTYPATYASYEPSLWIRNIQLSVFGLLFALPLAVYQSYSQLKSESSAPGWTVIEPFDVIKITQSFFEGMGPFAFFIIFMQITGGLLSAVVMQYSNNVAKCFSTSISILISFLLSIWLFDFQFSKGFVFGALMVVSSTIVYSTHSTSRSMRRLIPYAIGGR